MGPTRRSQDIIDDDTDVKPQLRFPLTSHFDDIPTRFFSNSFYDALPADLEVTKSEEENTIGT